MAAKRRAHGFLLVVCSALQLVVRNIENLKLRIGFGWSFDICVTEHKRHRFESDKVAPR